MSGLSLFGMFAVTGMLVSYALERRSPWYILAFAGSCALGSVYGFLQGAWPFGVAEAIWSLVAVQRWLGAPPPAAMETSATPTASLIARREANTPGSHGALLIRLLTGGVFLLEGIKKFILPADWGVGRFIRIGIWHPTLTAPFVGTVEIVCGSLLLVGLLTRLAAIPLLIDISVAIITTKIPILVSKGFWPMEAEARTDYAMLMGLLYLLFVSAGPRSMDAWRRARPLSHHDRRSNHE
jgi:putative oxidoreductase